MTIPQRKTYILYVEDDVESRVMLKALLAYSGIHATCTSGIAEAKKVASLVNFDLFILDLWLDDGDGGDLCRFFRKTYPGVPVLIYSACATERERKLGLSAGASEYIAKPYSEHIVPAIRRLTRTSDSAPEIMFESDRHSSASVLKDF